MVVYGNNQELASPQTNPDKERQSSIATIVDMMVPIACGVPCASVRLNFLRVILTTRYQTKQQSTTYLTYFVSISYEITWVAVFSLFRRFFSSLENEEAV